MQTDFEFTCHPPLGRLRIVGELDESSVDHLADVLESLALRGCTRVEVDVEEVSYIDPRCLHVLHEMHRRLRIRGEGVAMVGTNDYHRLVTQHAGYAALLPGAPAQDATDPFVVVLDRPGRSAGAWAHDSSDPDGTPDASRA